MGTIIDLTGYRYAKKAKKQDSHTYDALMYTLGKEAQRRLAKRTSTLEWVSIEDRLPEPSNRWFAVVLEHVGGMKTISGSQCVGGDWAHCRDVFSRVTHWAELPEELP
jgi:hypothetical protein